MLDAELISDKVPLIVKGMQLTPSSSNHFKKSDTLGLYAQIFVPQLSSSDVPPSLMGAKPADAAPAPATTPPAASAAPPAVGATPPATGATGAPPAANAAATKTTVVKLKYVIEDAKTKKVVYGTAPIDVTSFAQPGNPVVSVALKVPVDTLLPGDYLLLMQAGDNASGTTAIRGTTFSVE